ncbi:efflux transporter outer membrane subunit [bacterium]|nr:efflux transporter outer membrane subunit [bacterium]
MSCSVGPDYETPELSLPQRWSEQAQDLTEPDSSDFHQYWKVFGDEPLEHLFEIGRGENLTVQEIGFRLEERLASFGITRAQYFPDIDLGANLQKRRRSGAIASAIADLNNDLLGVGGFLNWEIDLLGRIRRLNESAKAQVEVASEEFNDSLVTLHAEIATGYIRYRMIQAQIQLTAENIRTQHESLRLAKDRFIAGIAPELDVKQADSNLGQTEAALPTLRILLAQELHRLAVLLGRFPEEVEPLLSDPRALPKLPDLSRDTLPLRLLRQRPDVRRAERALAAQHALIGVREAELYPIISLPGSFSFEALNTLEDAFRRDSLAYSVGPQVRWNLLDFGRIRGAIKVEDLRTKQAEARYRQQVLVAVQEVEDSLAQYFESQVRSTSLERSVIASRDAVKLVKSLYVAGLTDFQNVLDSERRLFLQEIALAENKGIALGAYIGLYRALGGGWKHSSHDEELESASETRE